MPDNDLTAKAAIRAFAFSSSVPAAPQTAPPATPSAAPIAPTSPTVTPLVEPHSHAGISPSQVAQMIEWKKENLAKGKITPEEANRRFDSLGATDAQRAPDTRSPEVKQLDEHFPRRDLKTSSFSITPLDKRRPCCRRNCSSSIPRRERGSPGRSSIARQAIV